jgi:NADH-quinone oxidoreductase subunit G
MYALKALLQGLGVANLDCRQDGVRLDPALGRASYLFNSTIEGIEAADAILIVGANPRLEAPVLNARLRKRWRQGGLSVGVIGEAADLTYAYQHLGAGPEALIGLLEQAGGFAETLRTAKRPLVMVGQAALARPDGQAVLTAAARIATSLPEQDGWNPLSVLHTAAGRVGGLDLGFVPGSGGLDVAGMVQAAGAGQLDVIYLLGADEIEMGALGQTFVIYQGSHGDRGAHRADVVLPAATYTEKSATYVNTEGRAQMTTRAVFPPGEAKEDWAIVRALSGAMGTPLPFDTLAALRQAMYTTTPSLMRIGALPAEGTGALKALAAGAASLDRTPFGASIGDFYLTNPIARASKVMGEMSRFRQGRLAEAAE